MSQLWYQQKFLDDTLRLKLGKLDGNDDFDSIDNAREFLNNSFSLSATLFLIPTYPDTAAGVLLFYENQGGFYAGAGAYDGSFARGVTDRGERPEALF